MLKLLLGLFIGIIELILTKRLIGSLLSGNTLETCLFIAIKFVLWGAFFAILVLFFRNDILLIGSGAAAGLVFGGFGLFLRYMYKQKREKEKMS